MACKRDEMIQEGASELLLSVFFDSPSVIRRQQAYSGAQGQYIRWCELEQLDPFTPNTLTLLNFLSCSSISLKWQAATVSTYKSAILNLFTDSAPITSDCRFKEFMAIIRSGTTKRLANFSLDLTPILQHFQKLGENDNMHIRDLTHKVCWLLGIAGLGRLIELKNSNPNRFEWIRIEFELMVDSIRFDWYFFDSIRMIRMIRITMLINFIQVYYSIYSKI
jgi:hypothetical protein